MVHMEDIVDLVKKANDIMASGTDLQRQILDSGANGNELHPSSDAIEAYRIGLDLFFSRTGIDAYISASEIVGDDKYLLKGFFDGYNLAGSIGDDNYLDIKAKYEKILTQFRSLTTTGTFSEGEYSSFLFGSVIAMRAYSEYLQQVRNTEHGENALNEIENVRSDLLERANYPLTYELQKCFRDALTREDYPEAASLRREIDALMPSVPDTYLTSFKETPLEP